MKNRLLLIVLQILLSIGIAQAASLDAGRTAYATYCSGCHGTPESSWNVSVATIQNAVQRNRGGMSRLSGLSATVLADIAAYMADPSGTGTTTASTGAGNADGISTGSVTGSAGNADADQLFDWAEKYYAWAFTEHVTSQNILGYYARIYPKTQVILGVRGGKLYFYNELRPQEGVLDLGTLAEWMARAGLTPTTAGTTGLGSRDNDGDSHSDNDDDDDNDNDDNDNDGNRDDNEGNRSRHGDD